MPHQHDTDRPQKADCPSASCSSVVRSLPKLPQSERPICDQISLLWAAAKKLGLYAAAEFIRPHMARTEENSGLAFHHNRNGKDLEIACQPCDGSAEYAHEWQITIMADSLSGAMDAVWNCWEAWQKGDEPMSGSCPSSMGHRMDYSVKKTKRPDTQNGQDDPREAGK